MSNNLSESLRQKANNLKQFLQTEAPRAVGTLAVNHFKNNFRKQGFDDNGVTPWKARKKETLADIGRAILIKKGNGGLRSSIKVISANTQEIIIGTNIPYAIVHNEGGTFNIPTFIRKTKNGTTTVKAHSRSYAQRKFIGNSQSLNKKINTFYKNKINNALKIK